MSEEKSENKEYRLFEEKKLVIASHNPGKIKEIKELFVPFNIEVVGGQDFNLEEPKETGETFIENASIKSQYFAEKTGLPSLSDDSGLVVELLMGDPGIYSARWAGPNKDFDLAIERVREKIAALPADVDPVQRLKPDASFVCALSLCWPDGHEEVFEGEVKGNLTYPPRGTKGFGYDPIFVANGYNITFAEMDPEEKHKISHRADAFGKLIAACFN